MSRVRRDILNGWKEIGAYVGRDIRTVERWEKSRGLPVRRVPGAGRATVYAISSEIDVWLSSAQANEPETATPDPASAPVPVDEHLPTVSSDVVQTDAAPEISHLASPEAPVQPSSTAPAVNTIPFRRRIAAWAGATVAAGIALAALWTPIVQARFNKHSESTKPVDSELSVSSSAVPYRSSIKGVDDLYLSGVYFYEQRTPAALQQSLQNFNEAIAKDPNYAPAYVGLANTYNLMREYAGMTDDEAFPLAKAAAERAVSLDPRLPQAHASLAFVTFFWSWDAVNAEKEFRTALSLDPTSALAHHWYGSMLLHESRFPEAIDQLNTAQRLQPTSAAILSTRALAIGFSGHRDEAEAELEAILKEAPSATSPHAILGTLSLVQPRNIPLHLREIRKVAELRHDEEWLKRINIAERAYRSGGETAMWTKILESEERLHPDPNDRTYAMAQAEAALGLPDKAFADIDQLVAKHVATLIGVANDPMFVPYHQDPRYQQIRASIGLPRLAPEQIQVAAR